MPLVYLITGASRGLGLDVVRILAKRPDTVIYAGARDPTKASLLQSLAKESSKVKLVKLEASSESDIKAVVETIKGAEGKVDIVLANAGAAFDSLNMGTAPIDNFRKACEVNTVGPIILYQAVLPIITKGGVFAVTSSAAGTLSMDRGVSVSGYGTSKAALNLVSMRIGYENKDVVSVAIHPGTIATEGAIEFVAGLGYEMKDVPNVISIKESTEGIVNVLDAAWAKKVSPQYLNWKGEVMPW